ncbi:MAG: indolepyruvate oxidoreductase [Ignavibacteria bacterium GWF2_33_9]|nr:MAG: indolepyruvate oxidoreductase [Ignavibacteria bacterium GWF2_33_9]
MNNENLNSEKFKKDIIIAGVGGQGIVSIASVIGYATLEAKLFFKQSEVHGMSQRGGDVQSHFRIANAPIHSDTIPMGNADLIISVEPMEALRYVNFLNSDGWIITNQNPYNNIPNYPDLNIVYDTINQFPHSIMFDAEAEARKIGTAKAANIVLLGAASSFLGMDYTMLETGIRKLFGRKGDKIVDINIRALARGAEIFRDIKK